MIPHVTMHVHMFGLDIVFHLTCACSVSVQLTLNIHEGKPDGGADHAAQQQLQQELTTSQDRVQELQQHADEQSQAWYTLKLAPQP